MLFLCLVSVNTECIFSALKWKAATPGATEPRLQHIVGGIPTEKELAIHS